jgi:serine/threonine protein kinase
MIGRQILNYRIVSSIGQGGMGEVFLAKHDKIDKTVAIKALLPSLLGNEMIRQRFINEAQSMSHLSHPKIVGLLDYHEDETGLYLIMEFVEGKPLDDIIAKETGPMTEESAVALMIQILEAFKYAHEKGLVHRDIKPSNIIVTPTKSVKVLDFGIAKIVGSGSNLTKTGTQMGTVYYMSPEQVQGVELDHRSDIYALGVTFYQMLTGTNPYSGITTEYEIYNQIVKEPLKSPKEVYPGVPEYLCKLVEKATAKDPADRYQNCGEMIEILKSKAVSKISARKPQTSTSNKKKIKPLLIAASILILLGIGYAAFSFIKFPSHEKIVELKLFPMKVGDEWGYADREGKIIIKPQYKYAGIFRDGLALVATGKERLNYGYIDESGNYVIPAQFDAATLFSEGIAWVVKENGKPVAINTKGEELFTADSAFAISNFHEGYAAFSDYLGNCGYYGDNGEIKISPQKFSFIEAGKFNDGIARVKIAPKNSTDSLKVDSTATPAVAKSGGSNNTNEEELSVKFINTDGDFIFEEAYSWASSFSNGMAIVKVKDKFGIIDKSGSYIVSPMYDSIAADGELFLIERDDQFGWIDNKGKEIIPTTYSDAGLFGISELAPVKNSQNQWGYINKQGVLKINHKFDLALAFNGNMAPVYQEEKVVFIDQNGMNLAYFQFDDISDDYIYYTEGIERAKVNFHKKAELYPVIDSILNNDESYLINQLHYYLVSDYFNAAEIISKLDFTEIADLKVYTATFDSIINNFPAAKNELRDSYIRLYNENDAANKLFVCPDLVIKPVAYGSPYYSASVTRVAQDLWGDYAYETTEQRYDGNRQPDSYGYYLILTEDKSKRKEHIIKELKKRLESEGYMEKKDEVYPIGYTKFEKADKWVNYQNEFEASYAYNQQYLRVEFGISRKKP